MMLHILPLENSFGGPLVTRDQYFDNAGVGRHQETRCKAFLACFLSFTFQEKGPRMVGG